MLRKTVAIVLGLLVVFVVVALLQMASAALHPLPEGLDPFDSEQAEAFAEYMAAMPLAAWSIAFFSELVAAFLGAATAGLIARGERRMVFAGAIVGLALIASVINWTSFAHPVWFIVGQLAGYPLVFFGVSQVLPELEAEAPLPA